MVKSARFLESLVGTEEVDGKEKEGLGTKESCSEVDEVDEGDEGEMAAVAEWGEDWTLAMKVEVENFLQG